MIINRKKILIFSLCLIILLFVFSNIKVSASEIINDVNLDNKTLSAGFTIETEDGEFKLGIAPNSSNQPLNIKIKRFTDSELPNKQNDLIRISDAYEFGIINQDSTRAVLSEKVNLTLKVLKGDIYKKKVILFWDRNKNEWRALKKSSEDLKNHEVTAIVPYEFGQIAVFEHPTTTEGFGSWYNYIKAVNRKKNADGVATHLYPMGTKLKITNLNNNKSVNVRVVSYWDKITNEKRRRAMDIVKASFVKIASVSEGVIPIKVELIPVKKDKAIVNDNGNNTTLKSDPIPTPTSSNNILKLKSRSAVVMDESGNVLFEKNSDKVYPVASLSKIFTAEVFLKTNPDWNKPIKLIPEDDAIGAKLFSPAGDIVTVKDLFYSMLTGSTNNGAKALARSTGLSAEEFANKMNEEAKSAGLTNSIFYEPTGLNPKNTSTAKEIATFTLSNLIQPEITQGTTKSIYSFDEIESVDAMIHHNVNSTNILLKEKSNLYSIISSKTGYLDESLYCLMMKVKAKTSGKIYTAVVLGSSTSAIRFSEMRTLLSKFVQ